jgi:hypothetical protein
MVLFAKLVVISIFSTFLSLGLYVTVWFIPVLTNVRQLTPS